MKVKGIKKEDIEVELSFEVMQDVAHTYIKEKPRYISELVSIAFCKVHGLPLAAELNEHNGVHYWEIYEERGSHYSGYDRLKNQPPYEATQHYLECMKNLFGCGLLV